MTLHDSNFVILDPLNLQNNTTKNSYHTGLILKQFQAAFSNLKGQVMKEAVQAKSNHSTQAILSSSIYQEQTQ